MQQRQRFEPINYSGIVEELVSPRLSPYGFNYDEKESNPSYGFYIFSRTEKDHRLEIVFHRRQYGSKELGELAKPTGDLPTEMPGSEEPIWVSNRFIGAQLCINRAFNDVTKFGIGIYNIPEILREKVGSREWRDWVSRAQWWKFHNEEEFRQALHEIMGIVSRDGIKWFDKHLPPAKQARQRKKKREKRER